MKKVTFSETVYLLVAVMMSPRLREEFKDHPELPRGQEK
jgi:hypothetical protein